MSFLSFSTAFRLWGAVKALVKANPMTGVAIDIVVKWLNKVNKLAVIDRVEGTVDALAFGKHTHSFHGEMERTWRDWAVLFFMRTCHKEVQKVKQCQKQIERPILNFYVVYLVLDSETHLSASQSLLSMDLDLQSNEYYYELRAHHSFYETIFKDYEPMQVWRQVLSFNPIQIRDKIVLDIGSGPGVFSLLAARAGARRVYAWEPSIQARYSERVIADNGFSDTITVFTGPIETVHLPELVDVLFTSSLGFLLYQDSLIPQFLYAKANFLKPDGAILPSRYSLSLTVCSPSRFPRASFWKDVYGFDYTPIEHEILNAPFKTLVASRLIAGNVAVLDEGIFDNSRECGVRDREFKIVADKDREICAFILWFDVVYEVPNRPIRLSTSPMAPDTHWMQICLPLPNNVNLHAGDTIAGRMTVIAELPQCKKLLFTVVYCVNDGESTTRNYVYR
jgi:protein arginine N-methyltransferase 1